MREGPGVGPKGVIVAFGNGVLVDVGLKLGLGLIVSVCVGTGDAVRDGKGEGLGVIVTTSVCV